MKFIFRLILLAIVLLILALIFAPNLISTSGGKALFFKLYKSITGTTVTAEKLKLSWWSGQKAENLCVVKDQFVLESKTVETDSTLWQILFYHNLGQLQIEEPKWVIETAIPMACQLKPQIKMASFCPSFSMKGSTSPFFGHIIVHQGEGLFKAAGFEPVSLRGVDLDITLMKLEMKLQGSGQTEQHGVEGRFDIAFNTTPDQTELDATLKNFPTRTGDQILALTCPKFQGAILDAVGEAIDIQVKLRNQPHILDFFCDASSDRFSAHIETKTADGRVVLATPATVVFQIPQALIDAKGDFHGRLRIDQLSLPLDDKESFSFQALLKAEAIEFPYGVVQPFNLFVTTENFKNRDFTIKADSPQFQLNALVHLPDNLENVSGNGEGFFPGNTKVDFSAKSLSSVALNVQSDTVQGHFEGGYNPRDQTLFSSKQTDATYLLSHLPSPFPSLKLGLKIEPFRLNLATLSGTISSQIHVDPFLLQQISIGDSTILASGDLSSKKGTYDLTTTVDQGPFKVTGQFGWPRDLTGKAIFSHIPMSIIDVLMNQPISVIVGPFLNGTAELTSKKQMAFQINNETFSAKASLEQQDQAVVLSQPASLTWTLTPEGYAALSSCFNPAKTGFKLTEPAVIKAAIPFFRYPLSDSFDLTKLCYTADLSIDSLAFSATKNIRLHGLRLHTKHDTPLSPYIFKFNGAGQPEGTANIQASFDFISGSTDLTGQLQQFPTEAFDVILTAVSPFSMVTLFGPQINLTARTTLTNWSGPIFLQLSSQNLRTSLNGTVNHGLLTLHDPFHVQMNLTEDLGKLLLQSFNPLSLSSITSEGAITLEIPPQGFSYPLFPHNDAEINIPQGRLELGKIYCRNEGNVNVTLGLLKLSEFSKNQNIELWVAPCDFHIRDGLLDCERTEILIARKLQICLWGLIDFVPRQVDMVLGLTASCLKIAFGVKNLPENYVMQIPLRGPFNNVQLNTGSATTKIGALLLWQQKAVQGALEKVPGGSIFGSLVKKIGPLPDMNAKAPPPKRPFPWEQKETSAVDADSNRIFSEDKPIKQVLKLLR